MTSTITFTRVGVGVLFGFAVTGITPGVLAADGDAKAGASVSTQKPETSRTEAASSDERTRIGLGLGLFTESSERRDEAFTGGLPQNQNDDEPPELESDSIFNIQAWFLQPILTKGLRWGAGIAWFNKYGVVEAEPENEDEEQEPFVFGHMFQLGLQGEYEIARVASKLNLVLGLRGGGSLLFPSDNLRDRIEELDGQGFDVWESPQLGAYVAPLAGVRWPLSERVAVRADLSVQFSKLWLYDAEGEAGGITSQRSATLGTTRTQLLIGLDFGL